MGCGQSKSVLKDVTIPEENSPSHPVKKMQQQKEQSENGFGEGEKDAEEIQSASTLQVESPNHSSIDKSNINNNNSNNDFTDNSSTVVIGQKVPSSELLQTLDNGDKALDSSNTPPATTLEARSPRVRRVSVCLDGAVVLESTFLVDSNNHPTCTLTPCDDSKPMSHDSRPGSHDSRSVSHDSRLGSHDSRSLSHDSRPGSHDGRPVSNDSTRNSADKDIEAEGEPLLDGEKETKRDSEMDTGSDRNSGISTKNHEDTLQAQPSAYLAIPPSPKRSVDLVEEKLAMTKYHTGNTV